MLPTKAGYYYALMLVVMLLASVNYNNGLAHLFTFFLGSLALVSMLYTHRNVVHLSLFGQPVGPVFAGEKAAFEVSVQNGMKQRRRAVGASIGPTVHYVDVEREAHKTVVFTVDAPKRGYVSLPPLTLTSAFPLGIFYTWSRPQDVGASCLVYPTPGPFRPLPLSPDRHGFQSPGDVPEGDDFVGLRDYQTGDPPRHVHWKAVAKGGPMITKQFGGSGGRSVWLDWALLPGMETEWRLSQLCRWVLDAEKAQIRFGLRLPGVEIAPDSGEEHRHRCLKSLALFQLG